MYGNNNDIISRIIRLEFGAMGIKPYAGEADRTTGGLNED
jgi:hypothetical protein